MGGALSTKQSQQSSRTAEVPSTRVSAGSGSSTKLISVRASLSTVSLPRLSLGPRRSSSNASTESVQEQVVASIVAELGETADVFAASNRRVLVMGSPGVGKSTLIRQMKSAYDGLDPAEAARYAKEVHKAALHAFKQPLQSLEPDDSIESVLAMNPRDLKKEMSAQQLRVVLADPRVVGAIKSSTDASLRGAFNYYASRLQALTSPGYVPDTDDLLRLYLPTVGRQETRLEASPVGALSLVEIGVNLKSSIFEQSVAPHYEELFNNGVEGIIFIASAVEAELIRRLIDGTAASKSIVAPQTDEGSSSSTEDSAIDDEVKGTASMQSPSDTTALWNQVITLAEKHAVPIFLFFSQVDLLQLAPLPGGLHFQEAKNKLLAEMTNVIASRGSSQVAIAAAPSTLNLHNGDETIYALEGVLDSLFPDDDDATGKGKGLSTGVYLGLVFIDAQDQLLMQGRQLPLALMKGVHGLNVQDHQWLQHLPIPLPSPTCASAVDAAIMGKGSEDMTARAFWEAAETLGRRIGDRHLGLLHPMPILVAPGTLLILTCSRIEHRAELGSTNKLRWKKHDEATAKMAKKMFGAELCRFDRRRPDGYTLDLARMQKGANGSDQLEHPSKWMAKLQPTIKLAAEQGSGLQNMGLRPGTYLCSMYLFSHVAAGLQVLTPDDADPCLLPMVQISNNVFSTEDMQQLQQMAAEIRAHKESSVITNDWAKAKAWMGPALGQEAQYTQVQKFFYGVIALRQRLGRRCTATTDELRTSKSQGAVESLSSLGTLYTDEIVCLDRGQQVHIIIVGRKWNLECPETFPGMRWYPVELFEMRHYKRLLPDAADRYCRAKLLLSTLTAQLRRSQQESDPLRESHLSNDSTDSTGGEQGGSLASRSSAEIRASQMKQEEDLLALEGSKKDLDEIWEALRWTKRVVKWMTQTSDSFIAHNGIARTSFVMKRTRDWAAMHASDCQAVEQRLDTLWSKVTASRLTLEAPGPESAEA